MENIEYFSIIQSIN